jgi:hypothetical protein
VNIDLHPDSPAICPADLDLLVSGYCSAWNEPDPNRRLHRLKSIWHESATFDCAGVHIRGVREMDAHIGAFCAGSRGWRFVVTDVTAHGRHVHLSWKLVDPTGLERLAGHDVGECSADRRFDRVVSFWRKGATASVADPQWVPRMSGT